MSEPLMTIEFPAGILQGSFRLVSRPRDEPFRGAGKSVRRNTKFFMPDKDLR